MIKKINLENEKFVSVIDCILTNFKNLVRRTQKKQNIFHHYVRVDDFHKLMIKECEIISSDKFLTYFKYKPNFQKRAQ